MHSAVKLSSRILLCFVPSSALASCSSIVSKKDSLSGFINFAEVLVDIATMRP